MPKDNERGRVVDAQISSCEVACIYFGISALMEALFPLAERSVIHEEHCCPHDCPDCRTWYCPYGFA